MRPMPAGCCTACAAGWSPGCCSCFPGAVVITALSAIYLLVGDVPLVQGLLFGLKAAVLAVVLEALIKVSKRALKGRRDGRAGDRRLRRHRFPEAAVSR